MNFELDEYEQEIEDGFGKNPLTPEAKEKEMALLRRAANNPMKKDKRITIRIYSNDLNNIKHLAVKEGLKYQSLITSVLHKFSEGRLKEAH